MESTVSELVAPQRFTTFVLSAFAVMAAGLAAIGIYGVVSDTLAQRTREIGVRITLGATARDVMKLILRQGMAPVAIGATIGLIACCRRYLHTDYCCVELDRSLEELTLSSGTNTLRNTYAPNQIVKPRI